MKKNFIIIGKPISHSLSPLLHNYWFKKYNLDAEYRAVQPEENDLKGIIKKIRNKEIFGANVTLPYKQKIISEIDEVVNDAKETFSVNTVYLDNESGKVIGENTDVFGLQAAYLKEILGNKNPSNNALVIGAGGVSPSIIVALIKSGLKKISITNRTYEKSVFLRKKFNFLNLISWEEFPKYLSNFDLIINATSLGLKGSNDFTFLFENFKSSLVYIDTIYNPKETKMIKHLKKNSIKTYNGLDMFIYQGQKSFYLWNKINPEIDNKLIELLTSKIND